MGKKQRDLKNNMPFKIGLTEKRREKLKEELNRLVQEISKFDVEKVILFGSLAMDDVHKSSDIDLIIIQRTNKKFLERLEQWYERLKPQVALDILVYTPEEFDEMKNTNQFVKSALKNGKIIYEKGKENRGEKMVPTSITGFGQR